MSALPSIKAKTPSETDQQQLINIYKSIEQNQAIIEFDLDGTILTVNKNFLTLFGYSLEDLAGKHHSQLCPSGAADSEEYKNLWADLRTGKNTSGEFRRVAADGHAICLCAIYIPVLDSSNKPCKVVKVANDITVSKTKSLEDDGKIEAINHTQAIIEFDLNGYVLTANKKFLEALDYTLQEVVRKHHRMFCDEAYV